MTELNEEKRFRGDMCMWIFSTTRRSAELIATPERLILKGPISHKFSNYDLFLFVICISVLTDIVL